MLALTITIWGVLKALGVIGLIALGAVLGILFVLKGFGPPVPPH